MDTITIVSVEDPALDRTQMDVRKYGETRDENAIREKQGMRAARFVVRDLTRAESDMCDERQSVIQKANWVLGFALISVAPGDGERLEPKTVIKDENGREKRIWSNEALDELRRKFGKSVMREVGFVIMQRDERTGEAFGGGVPRCTLLPLSLDALERIERRDAESNRTESSAPVT